MKRTITILFGFLVVPMVYFMAYGGKPVRDANEKNGL